MDHPEVKKPPNPHMEATKHKSLSPRLPTSQVSEGKLGASSSLSTKPSKSTLKDKART
ncbi:hypothetical protein MA16_Dca008355 [Dendrobium catenatum]|uniref:Uncharacterized protein n=1 Tax=Dendrobium catenatum TaxID=906689 RepID=A0A2I0W833_9ASPA|nr:hypothetical protein MA16_Dca008355 [Dendrobium catenatum]